MAKIYETQTDFERDKLQQQTLQLREKSSREVAGGLTWMVLSSIPEAIRSYKPEGRGWLSFIGAAMNITGIIEVIAGWNTRRHAHKLELEAERLGPQRVILPAEPTAEQQAHQYALHEMSRSFSQAIAPTSLLEQAQREDSLTGPKR